MSDEPNAMQTALGLGLGTLAALVLTAPRLIAAEPVSPLTQGLFGASTQDEPRNAQKFQTPDGATRFTLDRTGHTPLMRVEGRSEVIALTSSPGPRGDEYLKTDTGRVALKVSSMGGVTVYSGAFDNGAPVSASGAASRLSMPMAPVGGLTAKLSEIERNMGRLVGRPVSFDAPSGASLTSSAAVGLVADAAERAAEGLAAAKPKSVQRVIIQFGARPEARLEKDALRVTITPQLGYAGRPSADAVRAALAGAPR